MRKLMLFTVGFTIAAAAGAYILSGVGLLIFALACLTVGIIFVFLKRKNEWFLRIAAILLGCMLGGAWVLGYQLAYVTPAMEYHDQTVETTITAADYSEQTLYGYSTRGSINLNGNNYQLRLYTDDIALAPGDEIKGTFTLQCTAADEKNSDGYLRSGGIYFSANIRNMTRIAGGDSQNKIKKLLSFCGSSQDVADPWYTGDFDTTYNDVTQGCQALYNWILENL